MIGLEFYRAWVKTSLFPVIFNSLHVICKIFLIWIIQSLDIPWSPKNLFSSLLVVWSSKHFQLPALHRAVLDITSLPQNNMLSYVSAPKGWVLSDYSEAPENYIKSNMLSRRVPDFLTIGRNNWSFLFVNLSWLEMNDIDPSLSFTDLKEGLCKAYTSIFNGKMISGIFWHLKYSGRWVFYLFIHPYMYRHAYVPDWKVMLTIKRNSICRLIHIKLFSFKLEATVLYIGVWK